MLANELNAICYVHVILLVEPNSIDLTVYRAARQSLELRYDISLKVRALQLTLSVFKRHVGIDNSIDQVGTQAAGCKQSNVGPPNSHF
jgi:hypothetical protein